MSWRRKRKALLILRDQIQSTDERLAKLVARMAAGTIDAGELHAEITSIQSTQAAVQEEIDAWEKRL